MPNMDVYAQLTNKGRVNVVLDSNKNTVSQELTALEAYDLLRQIHKALLKRQKERGPIKGKTPSQKRKTKTRKGGNSHG